MSELEKELKNLVNEFLNQTCTESSGPPDFDKFPIQKRLVQILTNNSRYNSSNGFQSRFIFISILIALTALIWLPIFEPHDSQGADSCVWRTPDWLRDLTREPVNCSVCANLKSVDRIDRIEDREMFIRKYVDAGKPVVVSDASKNWLAQNTFSLEFFRSIYLNKTGANCQYFRYKSKFQSLKDVMENARLDEDEEPWYVGWSNCDGEVAEILRAHYDRPYFLPDNSESAHTDWIFMGSPGYGAHLHVDDVDYPSWQAQIRGTKKWLLYPPPECHYVCPREFREIILEPGDTLVVDTNWWYHKTIVIGKELSISIGSEFD